MLLVIAAQGQTLQYSAELNGVAGTGAFAPFWHVANRQGLGGVRSNNAYMRLGVAGDYHFGKNRNWYVEYGLDAAGGIKQTAPVFIQQAYANLGWKMLSLQVGQQERWSNFKNPRLTTGGLTESGNARPVPQVRFEVTDYWDLFRTNGWFTVRGHIAYGCFTDGNWQRSFVPEGKAYNTNVLYHSKAIYFKGGDARKFPLTVEFGLEMVAQFGGRRVNAWNIVGANVKNPARFKDYLMVLVPIKGDSQYSGMDQANIAGNQLGSWHGAITWNENNWNIRTYYEHAFEDHSQMFWEYGLWVEQLVGVELTLKKFKWIKSVAFEYFNLKDHSGPIYHDSTDRIPDQISCEDDNYNHAWYGGWFNYGMMIGTPLCTSPVYNSDKLIKCYNNRVEAFHLGIEGEPLNCLAYRLLITKSNNWGTYSNPYTDIKSCVSGLVELTFSPTRLKGWSATASFAFDSGTMYGNNYGAMVSIKKCGLFNFDKKR